MDFHKLLATMQQLDQPAVEATPVEACGDSAPPMGMPSMPPKADEPPPSMSVNLNAQGLDNIEELMKLIMKVNPDMDKPDMPGMDTAPMKLPPMGMPPLKMLPDLDSEPEGDHPEPDADNMGGPSDNDADNEPMGKMDIIKIGDKDDGDDKAKKEKEEEFANEPDTEYKDADFMNNKLAGGMNRPKGTFPKVADGDNPMQKQKNESGDLRAQIRAELLQRLAEAKGAK